MEFFAATQSSPSEEPKPVMQRPRRPIKQRLSESSELHAPVPQTQGVMAFSCPACFQQLRIKVDAHYNNEPAPCPFCTTTILPPQIVSPDSPALGAAPQLPTRRHRVPPPRRNMKSFEFFPENMKMKINQ